MIGLIMRDRVTGIRLSANTPQTAAAKCSHGRATKVRTFASTEVATTKSSPSTAVASGQDLTH